MYWWFGTFDESPGYQPVALVQAVPESKPSVVIEREQIPVSATADEAESAQIPAVEPAPSPSDNELVVANDEELQRGVTNEAVMPTDSTSSTLILVERVVQASRIEAYSLKVVGSSIQLAIKANAPISNFKHTYLGYKNALYYDLPGEWELATRLPTALKVKYPGMGLIRTGLHKEYLRIVFNLEGVRYSGTEARTTPDGLMITLNPHVSD